jgi:hypothetical protein
MKRVIFMRTVDHAALAKRLSRDILKIKGPVNAFLFWFGNLLPDYSYHTYCKSIGHGFRTARKKLALAWESKNKHGETAAFYFRLGVAAHYLCDSFTFPHNSKFKGSLKQHIDYEEIMHKHFADLKIHRDDKAPVFHRPEHCMRFLEKCHGAYLRQKEKSPKDDLEWIANVCRSTLLSSLKIPRDYKINIHKILEHKSSNHKSSRERKFV